VQTSAAANETVVAGLTCLVDRVEALGGKMTIQSQPGSGTSLLVNIPIESD
jgi:signal transduction histidine kinase